MSVDTRPGPAPTPGAPPVTLEVTAEPRVNEGGVVLVTARLRAERDVVLQGGTVSLVRQISYRYITGGIFGATHSSLARRSEVVATQALPGPSLLRGGSQEEHQVLLAVPADGPPSLACELATVAWRIDARMRFEGSEHADAPPLDLVVLGTGRDASTAGGTVMERGRRGVVDLAEVTTRLIDAGTRLGGAVVLGHAAGLRSVKVELVLVQLVPHGPVINENLARSPYTAPKEAEEVVARVVLAGADTPPAERLPFVLEVPALPAPSVVTEDFRLQWVLRATVRRRVVGIPLTTVVDLEVQGSTAPVDG
jgi:hypothetical protein